jgi:hypothetical protein
VNGGAAAELEQRARASLLVRVIECFETTEGTLKRK